MNWRNALTVGAISFVAALAGLASAQIVGSLPFQLQNNTLADATQVMANYNAIVDGVNTNAAKNGVNNDITQLVALAVPLTTAQGGSTFKLGGNSTGSPNAQVVASVVPAGVIANGATVSFIAGFTNTGDTTVDAPGLGPVRVFRNTPYGPFRLAGGEIVANFVVVMYYDGGNFNLLNNASPFIPGQSITLRSSAIPNGFLAEDGSCVSQTTYPALFAAISTTYGSCGAGNFNLPDSRGRMDAGVDGGAGRITFGVSGCNAVLAAGCGAQSHTLTAGESAVLAYTSTFTGSALGTHSHTTTTINGSGPVNGTLGAAAAFMFLNTTGAQASNAVSAGTPAGTVATSSNAGGTAFSILNPVLIATKVVRL